MTRQILLVALGVALGAAGVTLAQHAPQGDPPAGPKHKVLLEQVLSEKLDGKEAKVHVLEVEWAPGASSAPHRHPGSVVGYVLEGELETQVEGQERKVYKKGEVFYEPARALHAVAHNPGKTQATRVLAFMLAGKDDKALVIPEKQ